MRSSFALLILFSLLAFGEEQHLNFESGKLDNWKVIEGSLEKPLADLPNFHGLNKPYNREGKYHLSTLETSSGKPSDKFRAVVESDVFTLKSDKVSFLIGGGSGASTYFAICDFSGKEVFKARGKNNQTMVKVTWNVSKLVGKDVFFRLYDDATAGWGHITVDDIRFSGVISSEKTVSYRKARKKVLGQKISEPVGKQASTSGITHEIFITGQKTIILNEKNKIIWEGRGRSKDGFVLANGNVLVAYNNEVIEYDRKTNKVVFNFKVSKPNKEISSAQRLANGNTLVCELGSKPRGLEISPDGKVVKEVALQPETNNTHMQTRTLRQLKNGNYLAGHLFGFGAKEYDKDGKVVKEYATDTEEFGGKKGRNWVFTAVRLPNSNTLASCTNGHKVVEFDKEGKVVWSIKSSEVDGKIRDACGAQRLPNGNTVIICYGQRNAQKPRIIEVDKNKKIVWELMLPYYVHTAQVLTTSGKSWITLT